MMNQLQPWIILQGRTTNRFSILQEHEGSEQGETTSLENQLRFLKTRFSNDRILLTLYKHDPILKSEALLSIPKQNIFLFGERDKNENEILFPLFEIARKDSKASLIVLPTPSSLNPSDLHRGIAQSLYELQTNPSFIFLLGIQDPSPSEGQEWILTLENSIPTAGRPLTSFHSHQSFLEGKKLLRKGALLYSGHFAASASTLLLCFSLLAPGILKPFFEQMESATPFASLESLYKLSSSLSYPGLFKTALALAPQYFRVLSTPNSFEKGTLRNSDSFHSTSWIESFSRFSESGFF